MPDTPSENLLRTIVKKLDKLIECVKELIKILGGKSERWYQNSMLFRDNYGNCSSGIRLWIWFRFTQLVRMKWSVAIVNINTLKEMRYTWSIYVVTFTRSARSVGLVNTALRNEDTSSASNSHPGWMCHDGDGCWKPCYRWLCFGKNKR